MASPELETRTPAHLRDREAGTAARIGGGMLLAGGSVSVLMAVTVPGYPADTAAVVSGLSFVAMLLGGWCLWRPTRVRRWGLLMFAPYGTVWITLTTALTGTPGDGSELLYIWPVLFTAYFFPIRVAFANAALITAVYPPVAIAFLGTEGVSPSVYLFGTSVVTVLIVSSLRRKLDDVLMASELEARTDGLTGLANRRSWEEAVDRELGRQARTGSQLCLLMIDLDYFKRLNDSLGHAAGDDALARVSEELRAGARQSDVLARLGGEEFGLLLPGCSPEEAFVIADTLRARIAAASKRWAAPVTVSIGVACLPDHAGTAEQLIIAADEALYEAKDAGRDRVAIFAERSGDLANRRRQTGS